MEKFYFWGPTPFWAKSPKYRCFYYDSELALNTAKDYSGKTCDGVTYPAKNATISGVYKLDGSSLLINTDNITSVGSTVFTKQ